METFKIEGKLRENTGKKYSMRLRKEGKIPCVLYGGKEVVHFSAPEKAFKNLIYTPNIYLLKINIDGKNYDALLKDIQFHPVTDSVLHIDFIEVSENKPVVITMPVKLTGDSIGIKNGGKLRWKRRQMKVKGLPADLPDYLDVDITNLEIGQTIKVGELSYDNLQVLDPARSMVASVVSSRLVAKGMAAPVEEEKVEEEVEAEAEVPAEGAEETAEAKPESEKPTEKEE